MKLHIVLIYLCVIVAGGAFIADTHRGAPVKLVATRGLPANHLLQPGDLVLQTTNKQYTTKPVPKDSVVDSREIATAPDLMAKKGFTPFPLAVDPKEVISGAVDAGQTLFVCPVKVPAEVRGIFCSGDGTSCVVILHVADGDKERLSKAGQVSLQKACG
jgi:hypothetical protein